MKALENHIVYLKSMDSNVINVMVLIQVGFLMIISYILYFENKIYFIVHMAP